MFICDNNDDFLVACTFRKYSVAIVWALLLYSFILVAPILLFLYPCLRYCSTSASCDTGTNRKPVASIDIKTVYFVIQ